MNLQRFSALILLTLTLSCMSTKEQHDFTNALIEESSPYLLQHAHNPVNWHPWTTETLEKAKAENKLLLISIGYSSCHWCHVMEHESFEDTAVAAVMNDNYICIKVDREERPDVDQIYMNAVQLMTKRGGWPLNCVALPNGRPIWGGTYFPKDQWVNALTQVAALWDQDPAKAEEYAARLTEGVRMMELIERPTDPLAPSANTVQELIADWKKRFDTERGGPNRAPKFPMPTNQEFLLRYGVQFGDSEVRDHVHRTLRKMVLSGIYDQVVGGWARYATDVEWKIPHFEKMLYDNGQLLELYSQAFRDQPDPLYAEAVHQSIEWLMREMYDAESGSFYSALDADSEGEEGAFYIWTEEELREHVPEADWELFAECYHISPSEKWEGKYILHRTEDKPEYERLRRDVLPALLQAREKRERPGLDDKSLTAWNAMTVSGLVAAYRTFDREDYLQQARTTADWILKQQGTDVGGLWHTYKLGKSTIDGFLDDYALSIKAYLDLYECTFDEVYLQQAHQWTLYCFDHFYSDERGMFFYTSNSGEELVARSMETADNVIPASNSVMAHQLYRLSFHFERKAYRDTARTMLRAVEPQTGRYAEGYSNWLSLYLNELGPYYEVVLIGPQAQELRKQVDQHYLPNALTTGASSDSDLPLHKLRFQEGTSLVYLCEEGACQLPTEAFEMPTIAID